MKSQAHNKILNKKASMNIQCYLMLSVQLIGFMLITIYPIIWAIRLAWFSYDGVISNTRFVGWDNFVKIFTQDTTYWQTWLTTIKFALFKLPVELPLAMFIAVKLNKNLKGRGFFRAAFYLPNVVAVAIIGLIFSSMFDYFGIINAWLLKLGVIKERIDWFANTGTAMFVLVAGAVWNTFGLNVLYFISAMQNIPEEMYESAHLDGASKSVVFFKITLPLMAPVLQTILLLSLVGTLHTSDYVLVMTNGAPRGETFTVMSYIVNQFVPGFADSVANIGYGCALSLVTTIIMAAVAIVYNKLSAKMSDLY